MVTFPSQEESQSHGKNVQKVLAMPWDYRIPKIRISTQQAEALQVNCPLGPPHPACFRLLSAEMRAVALAFHIHCMFLHQDFRVIVRIDSWESTSLYPNGHFVRVLGRIGDLEGEVQTILVENSICVSPFSEAQVSVSYLSCLF